MRVYTPITFMVLLTMMMSGCSTRQLAGPPPVDVPEPGATVSRSPAAANSLPAPTSDAPRVVAVPESAGLVTGAPGASNPSTASGVPAPTTSDNSAVNTLLARAESEWINGNSDAAVAAAERALRIAPSDPNVYLQLAELRLARAEYALAEQLARKGLSYRPAPALRQRLLHVLERAQNARTLG